jgi:hypothetical protein
VAVEVQEGRHVHRKLVAAVVTQVVWAGSVIPLSMVEMEHQQMVAL